MVDLRRLLPLLAHILYLTPSFHAVCCSAQDPTFQQKLDRVDHLPGQSFDVNFTHYSGYVTVNEKYGRAFLYWFIEAVEDPSSKPLLLWLNGGPGCSSIAYGEAEELGPFHVEKDGRSLYLNPYSWNNVVNVLFLDAPVGVGFSYSNTSSDLLTNGDRRTAEDSLIFLLEWFERFPQYKDRDFYITGESYAGHYVPQLSRAIVRYNAEAHKKMINLKGYMVGNACTDELRDHFGLFQFWWSTGLISDETCKQLHVLCDFEVYIHMSKECRRTIETAKVEMGNIDLYSIYTPPCSAASVSRKLLMSLMIGHPTEAYDPCTKRHSLAYFNQPEVQKALHVNPKFAPTKWEICSELVSKNWKDSSSSVLEIYQELMAAGLRIWMFSGNTDAVVPVTSTRFSIDALKLRTIKPWHAWYDEGQVGGWIQEFEGLTFVVVKGSGHEVPLHQPKLALTLIKSFLAGEPMPTLSQVSDS